MIKTVEIGRYLLFADGSARPGLDILQSGVNYERHVRLELERLIPSSCGFLDVGANVGVHTLNAKDIRPDIPVVAVELSQKNVELLLMSITVNKVSDVTVVPCAMASVPTIIRANNDENNTSCSSDLSEANGYPHLTAALSLDFLRLPQIDLMKIDVEGFEFAVWRGATRFFAARPRVIFEFCPQLVGRSGTTPEKQLQWLLDKGYTLTVLDYLPGIRKTFTEAQAVLDYVKATSGWITDILAEPV